MACLYTFRIWVNNFGEQENSENGCPTLPKVFDCTLLIGKKGSSKAKFVSRQIENK